MGLDIRYYSGLKLAPGVKRDHALEHWKEYAVLSDACIRAEGVPDINGVYTFDQSGGFAAGSYGTYNGWRELLAKLAGWTGAKQAWKAQGGPFWELINFTDCDGTIGPVVSAKLAQDFAELQDLVDGAGTTSFGGDENEIEPSDVEWFRRVYADFRKAFETAAQGGAVVFH